MKAFEAERDFYNKYFGHMMTYTTHDGARTARTARGARSSRASVAGHAQTNRSASNSVSFAHSPSVLSSRHLPNPRS